MSKYLVEVHIVERYSSNVLVEAENAQEAKRLIDEDYQNCDYIYEKTTDNPDSRIITYRRPKKLTEEQAERASKSFDCLRIS